MLAVIIYYDGLFPICATDHWPPGKVKLGQPLGGKSHLQGFPAHSVESQHAWGPLWIGKPRHNGARLLEGGSWLQSQKIS